MHLTYLIHFLDTTSEYGLRIKLGVYQSSESLLLMKGGREETRNAFRVKNKRMEPHFDISVRELNEQPNPSIKQRTTNVHALRQALKW